MSPENDSTRTLLDYIAGYRDGYNHGLLLGIILGAGVVLAGVFAVAAAFA